MADITNELNAIKKAIYGEEVRGSIHDAISKINGTVEGAIEDQIIDLDTTFTLSGSGSDAKVTGDIISSVREYDSTKTYAIGDYIIYKGYLRRCKTAITTPEAWDISKWDRTNITTELNERFNLKRPIPLSENTDLNDVIVEGYYNARSTAIANTILNQPAGATYTFSLIVMKMTSSTADGVFTRQIYLATRTDGLDIYIRASGNALNTWGEWYKISDASKLEETLTGILSLKDSTPISIPSIINKKGIVYSTGEEYSSTIVSHTDYINVEAYKKISYRKICFTTNSSAGISFYDSNKAYIEKSGVPSKQAQPTQQYDTEFTTVEVPDNAKYVRCSTLYDRDTYGDFELYGRSVILDRLENDEEIISTETVGPTVTVISDGTFVARKFEINHIVPEQSDEPSFTDPEPLFMMDAIRYSVSHNDGSTSTHEIALPSNVYGGNFDAILGTIKSAVHISLTGSSSGLSFTNGQLRYSLPSAIDTNARGKMACSHGKAFTGSFANLPDGMCMASAKTFAYYKEEFENLDQWKAYLDWQNSMGTPLEFVYQPEEPETISLDSYEFKLKTKVGVNLISSTTGEFLIGYISSVDPHAYVPQSVSTVNGKSVRIINYGASLDIANFKIDYIITDQPVTPTFTNPIPLSTLTGNLNVTMTQDGIAKAYEVPLPTNTYGVTYDAKNAIINPWERIVLTSDLFKKMSYKNGQLRMRLATAVDNKSKRYERCSHCQTYSGSFKSLPDGYGMASGSTLALKDSSLTSLDDWLSYLSSQISRGTPVEFLYKPYSVSETIISTFIQYSDTAIITNVTTDRGEVSISHIDTRRQSSYPKIDVDLDAFVESNGTKVFLTKIKRTNFDGTVNIPHVGCGELTFVNGEPTYCSRLTTKDFASQFNSPVVMNGGFFALSAGTNVPHGSVIVNGNILLDRTYHNNYFEEALCIHSDGHFSYTLSETMNAQTLRNNKVLQCFCGIGPIISNGVILSSKINNYPSGPDEIVPLNILAYSNDYYYILTCSGRLTAEPGISLSRAVQILTSYDVTEAYLMDGGGSVATALYGKKLNKNIDSAGDRPVSTVVYFKPVDYQVDLIMKSL